MRELIREKGARRMHCLISFPCDYFKLLHFLAENIIKIDFFNLGFFLFSFSFFCVSPVEFNGLSDSYCASLKNDLEKPRNSEKNLCLLSTLHLVV